MCCHTATSERGCGWVGYLPSDYNARSEASEHAFARVTIHRQNPITPTNALRRQFHKVASARYTPLTTLGRYDIFSLDKSKNYFT